MIPHLMSLLSHSQRAQEYITQIFAHCCKVFIGICTHTNTHTVESITLVTRPRFIGDWTFVVSRPQSIRRFFSTTAPSRTLPLYLSHPLIRYLAVSLWVYMLNQVDVSTFHTHSSHLPPVCHSILPTNLMTSAGPNAGVKVFLSPGL